MQHPLEDHTDMIRFAKLTDYALRIATELARAQEQTHSSAQLSERTGLEATTVAKVLKQLGKRGLVESFRGASGGYRLVVPAPSLTVASIVEAMEGPLGLTACVVEPGSCMHEGRCAISAPMHKISRVIENALRAVSLDELSRAAPTRPQPKPNRSIHIAGTVHG